MALLRDGNIPVAPDKGKGKNGIRPIQRNNIKVWQDIKFFGFVYELTWGKIPENSNEMSMGTLMHDKLWEKLRTINPQKAAQYAQCKYDAEKNEYTIEMLAQEYTVSTDEKSIFPKDSQGRQSDAVFLEQLVILACLVNANDVKLAGKLVGADALDAGKFFFRGPHALPTKKLEDAFGHDATLIYAAIDRIDGKRCQYGDASIEITVLPKLPLVFVIWAGDDEFAARASILFDKSASEQLPLDAISAAVIITVNTVIEAAVGTL